MKTINILYLLFILTFKYNSKIYTMRFFKSALLLFTFSTLVFSITIHSQTTLVAGDIAILSYNADEVGNEDEFTFLLLRDIAAGTVIRFTDFGWTSDINGFQSANPCGAGTGSVSDGAITWTAPAGGLLCGTQVHVECGGLTLSTSAGTVIGLQQTFNFPGEFISLSPGGDQIFAFQGTLAVPTLITAINMNGAWDATLLSCTFTATMSVLPAALSATTSVAIVPEIDNSRYNCTVTNDSPTNLKTAIFNVSNWTGDDITPFTLPLACTFGCNSCTNPTVPTVSASTPICGGGNSILTITGTLNSATAWHIYAGSCGGTLVGTTASSTFIVSPGATTTYFVRGEGGCVTPGSCGSTTVTVNTAPATPGSISGTTTVCSGSSNTYSVTAVPGAISYTWTLPGGWTGTSTTNSITTTAGATGGNITVNATNTCGTSGTSSQSITVNPTPLTPGFIAGTSPICSGSSNTYSVTAVPGATSYTWTLPGGWTGTSTTNSITTTASATGGNISVTASNTCGTSGSSSRAITVPSAIVLTIASQTNETCGLLNAALSVNPATGGSGGYIYDWTPGTPTGDGTTSITGIGVGIWTCMVTDATSCTATVNATITNTGSLDNASFNYSAASYCTTDADPTPTITGLPGGSFSSTAGLSINASTGVIDLSASTPATYTVTYLTAGPCPNSTMVSVTILGLDDASFNYSAAAYCLVQADPTPTITGLAGGTFSSTAGLSINASTGVIDVSASTPGNYTVTYTTSGPCPNSSNVSVAINALNTITLSSPMGSNTQSLLINTAIDNITYTTTGATGSTFSGLPMGVMGIWAGDIVTISGSPTEDGIFNYTVTLTGGCGTVTASGTITVATCNLTLSSAPGTFVQAVCVNDPITDITYTTIGATGATVTGLPTGVTGTWASNVVTISGTPNSAVGSPFNYTVTLVGGGCSNVTNGIIRVSPSPDVSQPSNQVVCNDGSTSEVPFTGSEPGTVFNWTNSDPTIGLAVNGTGNIPSFTATNAGTAPIVATITVTPSLTTSSAGNALNFDGVNDQAISSLPPVFNDIAANNFTMEAWVYPTGSTFSRIIYAQLNTNNFASMTMGGGRYIYLYVIRGGTTFSAVTTNTIPLNQWTHVATKWTAATNTIEVYFNGVLQPSVFGGGSSIGTTTSLVIGSRPGGAQYFPGILDEIRIWNTARTQVEISATMNSSLPGNTSGIEVYYKLDEGTGIATADASPAANTSSLSGSPAWQVPSTAPLFTTCTGAPATYTYTITPNPSTADAGPNQTVMTSMVTLAANTPTVGTGAWSIESGAGGSVTTPSSPTSTFIGVAGTTYTLRWTISNAPCGVSMDDVEINFIGIAQIMGGAIYNTLQAAIDNATPGQTIMLLAPVSEPNVNISNSVTINANGFSLTIPTGNFTIPTGNSLTWISGNLIIATGANIDNDGTLCNNATIDFNNPSPWTNTGLYKGTGTFNGSITNNGTFSPGN
jgi:hypothetical protein